MERAAGERTKDMEQRKIESDEQTARE